MTCFIAQNELSALADEALESGRAAELHAHLSGCASCTRELQEIRRVRTLLRGLPVHRAPVDFLAKVKAKAERKSFFERAGAAIEPLLRLPRPMQAGLALAASLVIAVTVFINPANKRGSVWDGSAAPGAARSLSEVANVQATSTPAASTESFSKRTNLDGDLAGGEKNENRIAEGLHAPSDEQAKLESQLRDHDANAGLGFRQDADKANWMGAAPAPTATPAPTALALADRETARRMATPAPTATPRALGGVSGGGSSSMGSTGNSASYSPPTQPGLYSSTPQAIAVSATPQPKPDASKAKAGAVAPNKSTGKELATEVDDRTEPAYEASAAFAEPATDSVASGDDWGAGKGAGADPAALEEKARSRDSKDQGAKKDLRRASKSGESAPAGAAGRAMGADVPAEAESTVATGSVAVAAPVVESPSPAAATLSAKFVSAASTAPQDVVAAAKAAGGKLVSPANTPPGLGKAGASTVVIVEVPAAGVAAFEEKLRLSGTLERGALPGGAVRYRIEVVRQ